MQREMMTMKRILFAVACASACVGVTLASGKSGSHKPDGTNVWVGAASGGLMSVADNWECHANDPSITDPLALMQKHVVLDFSNLANGAVVTNDITTGNTYKENSSGNFIMVAGIIYNGGEDDVVRYVKTTGKGGHFTDPCYLDINGGTFEWNDYTDQGYPRKVPHKRGAGVFRFVSNMAYFWESCGYLDAGTLAFNGVGGTSCYAWKIGSGCTFRVESGSPLFGSLFSDASVDPSTSIEVGSGSSCEIAGGWNTFQTGRGQYYGALKGDGTLKVTGGVVQEFLKGNQTVPHPFSGLLIPQLGDICFGTDAAPLGVNPLASAEISGGGWLRFHDDQTLAAIRGGGVDGGIALPATKSLTVGDASTNVYSGRIVAKDLEKTGSGQLNLEGAGAWTGATAVRAGTLKVGKGFYRKGLAAYWTFDDPSDWGADSSSVGALPVGLRVESSNAFRPYLIDDGVSGKAIHFGDGDNMSKGGCFRRNVPSSQSLANENRLPTGSSAFTFSFWMRPTKGKCGNGTNFIHFGPKNGDQTTEEGVPTGDMGWSNNFFFGSPQLEEGTKNSLGAFKHLCFYTGCTWTRGGVYDSSGNSNNVNKVALAKFDDGNYLFDGAWHHIVGTYSNRLIRIFVDGKKMDERTRLSDLWIEPDVYYGFGIFSTDHAHTYQGDLDELQWLRVAWSEEEVLAEYNAKKPKAGRLLPDPVAHWTFDTKRSEDGTYYFDDVSGNGFTLKAAFLAESSLTPENELQMESVTYPEDHGSKAFWIKPGKDPSTGWDKAQGGHLELADGIDLSTKIPVGSAFTVSLRRAAALRQDFFCFGDPEKAENNIRFFDDGTPSRLTVKAGSDTKRYMSTPGGIYPNPGLAPAAWVLQTVTYDPATKVLCGYLDGRLALRVASCTINIDPKQVAVNWNGRTGSSAQYGSTGRYDDLRIYNEALDPEQVAALAKVTRFFDGTKTDAELLSEQAELPAESPVTVAEGATFAIRPGFTGTVKSISGAGTVKIESRASLSTRALAGFTGKVIGGGALVLDDLTLDLAKAGSSTPFVDAAAPLAVADAGTIAVTGGEAVYGKTWLIAKGGSYTLPADFAEWKVSEPTGVIDGLVRFFVKNGDLYVKIRPYGAVIILK